MHLKIVHVFVHLLFFMHRSLVQEVPVVVVTGDVKLSRGRLKYSVIWPFFESESANKCNCHNINKLGTGSLVGY